MKARLSIAAVLAGILVSGAALADTACDDPVASWQPRESLRQKIEQRGWVVQRIKVDDGCYEVRGRDRKGNKFKATYAPASLRLLTLEIDFGPAGDASDYMGLHN